MPAPPLPTPNISQPRNHHRQIPNNVPNPPHQQPPPTPLSKLNSLSSQILKKISRAWKSFQERSLANDQRYNLDTLLSTISSSVPQHHTPRQSTPYPETPIVHQASSYERPASLPIPSTPPALSYDAHVMTYQPGHRPAIQSPYYLLICLPIENIAQDSAHRRPSPSSHRVILCCPYRPYRTTIPVSSSSGGAASGEP